MEIDIKINQWPVILKKIIVEDVAEYEYFFIFGGLTQHPMQHPQLCLECSNALLGRADKKFCNEFCRNSFNNRIKCEQHHQLKPVNRILLKNRKILQNVLKSDKIRKIRKSALFDSGFNFSYHTHAIPDKKGSTYYFVYEVGYQPLSQDLYVVCRNTGL